METLAPETVVAFVVALMFVLVLMTDKVGNPGYRCPACGSASAREHSDSCSWAKHYGDD